MKNPTRICLLMIAILITAIQAQAQYRKSKPPMPAAAAAPYDAAEEKALEEMRHRFPVDYVPNPLDILGHSKNDEIPHFAILEYRLKYSEYDKRYTAEPNQLMLRTNGEYITMVDVYEGYGGQLPLGLSFPLTGKKAEATAGKNVLQKTDDALLYQTNDYRMYLELPQKSMNKNINHIYFVYTGEFKKYTPWTAPTPVAETPKAEIAEEKKVDDYAYKKHFDLLSLYRYLGNYIDSNRVEIKTEGESVFYKTEERFPGTVENYIEVKNGKGELKYVFYRGNDKTAADNKYNEIVAIATRLKDASEFSSHYDYCDGCSGIAFGTNWSYHFWVQVVNKPAGVYEVQLIYSMPLNSYYLTKKAIPVTTTPSTTITSGDNGNFNKMVKDMEEKKAADKVSAEQALKTAIQEDFCAAIQRVVKDYPNNFETLKAAEKKFYLSHTFTTKYSVKGALETEIQQDMMMDLNTHKYYNAWFCSLFEGPSTFMDIVSLNKDYVNKINACITGCCELSSTSGGATDVLGNKGSETVWTVKTVKPGNSKEYTYMKIRLEFILDQSKGNWSIRMWVS